MTVKVFSEEIVWYFTDTKKKKVNYPSPLQGAGNEGHAMEMQK